MARLKRAALKGTAYVLEALGDRVVIAGWKRSDPALVQHGSNLMAAAVVLSEMAEDGR